jgi:hypothetical protein
MEVSIRPSIFFSNGIYIVPKTLEAPIRYSKYLPNIGVPNNLEYELGLIVNLFPKGIRINFTTEYSYFKFESIQEGLVND